MEIHYALTFDQPWRVGSGEAAGAWLDGLVRRDGHGLPFVPGSTVRGLAADALGTVVTALGLETCQRSAARLTEEGGEEGEPGSLCGVTREGLCPACGLFGSNFREGPVRWGPARLAWGDADQPVAELPKAGVEAVRASTDLLFRGRPRTAIDRKSGRAEDQHLFALEEVLPDWRFTGRIDLGNGLSPLQVSLLLAALRFVREVGSSRRRGLGRCRFEVRQADLGLAFPDWRQAIRELADLEELQERPAPVRPAVRSVPLRLDRARPAVLQVHGAVIGELSVGGRPEAGNLVSGLAYVPGSTLRGALAARWQGGYEGDSFARAFLSGTVQFGYLYPNPVEGSALPTPRSMATCKLHSGLEDEDGHGVFDLLPGRGSEDCPVSDCGARLVPRVKPFTSAGKPRGVEFALSPHNAIDPGPQTVRQGGLFAYEALPEGRRVMGFIRGESHEVLEELLSGLGLGLGLAQPFELRVGRRKGSLGALVCTLEQWQGKPGGIGLFPDQAPVPTRAGNAGAVRIDLLTPAIVLDLHLRFKSYLGSEDFGLQSERFSASFCDSEVLAGWNSAHRLPKSDQIAVVAGSTFRIDNVTEAELAALAELAGQGIGLRREEGFGQFLVREIEEEKRP